MIVNEPVPDTFEDTPAKDRDPDWFKRAVFYEVLVRSFQDSNGDGIGDLKGITAKLDYLQWLGVDCLWLPPFFKSPLRDGGYDVSDYTAVLPEFGDLADFVEFVDAAHQRGMRVIIDFVMNHTSDQHEWFQQSRTDPDGPYGDYYVWADDDKQFQDARIIFVDTETSNWTFDPVRKQYYWHRFFSHQPDLNYENPAVQEEILAALRFWLDLGIDGFRVDAVPYLYQREGTNCENLPETHNFLKRVRKEIDANYPDTVLLAEANQWPEDVVDYFGDYASGGDECHMAFHFPVMPRIFMAVRRESRYPVSEILAKTPAIPKNCQWGIFLRNHDELTLEMVTDEERDYMYAEYAKDPRMRANIGIRHASPRCWTTTATRSSCSPHCCCRCPAPRSSTTGTRSGWATTSGWATATPCAPRCSGRPTATPGSPPAIRGGSTSPRSWTRSTATRSPTSRRRWRRRPRCCTGPAA